MDSVTYIVGLIAIIIVVSLIAALVKKGREYEMRVFLSKQYAGLCIGIVLSLIAAFTIEPREPDALVTSLIIAVSTFSLVAYSNIKKSSILFGLVFTLFQTVMTVCFFLFVLAIVHFISERRPG